MFRFFNFSSGAEGNSSNVSSTKQELPQSPVKEQFDIENPEFIDVEKESGNLVQSEIYTDDPFKHVHDVVIEGGEQNPNERSFEQEHQYTPKKELPSENSVGNMSNSASEGGVSIRSFLTQGLSFWTSSYRDEVVTDDWKRVDSSQKFNLDEVEVGSTPSVDFVEAAESHEDLVNPTIECGDPVYTGPIVDCSLYMDQEEISRQITLDNTLALTRGSASQQSIVHAGPPLGVIHTLHSIAHSMHAFLCQPASNSGRPLGSSLRLPKNTPVYNQQGCMIIDLLPRSGCIAHALLTLLSGFSEAHPRNAQPFVYVAVAQSIAHAQALYSAVVLQSFIQRGQLLIATHETEHQFWHLHGHPLLPLHIQGSGEFILDLQVPVLWLMDRHLSLLPTDLLLSQRKQKQNGDTITTSSRLGVRVRKHNNGNILANRKEFYTHEVSKHTRQYNDHLDTLYAPVAFPVDKQLIQQYAETYPVGLRFLAAQCTKQQLAAIDQGQAALRNYSKKMSGSDDQALATMSSVSVQPVKAIEQIDYVMQSTILGMLIVVDFATMEHEQVLHDSASSSDSTTIDCPALTAVLDQKCNLIKSLNYSCDGQQHYTPTLDLGLLHAHQTNKGALSVFNVIDNNMVSTSNIILQPPIPESESVYIETYARKGLDETSSAIAGKTSGARRYLAKLQEQPSPLGQLVATWGCRYDSADTNRVNRSVEAFATQDKEALKKKASFWGGNPTPPTPKDLAVAAAAAWTAAREALRALVPLQLREIIDVDLLLQRFGVGKPDSPAFVPRVAIHALQCLVARLFLLRHSLDIHRTTRNATSFVPSDVITEVILPWINTRDVVADRENAFLSTMIDLNQPFLMDWNNVRQSKKARLPYLHMLNINPRFLSIAMSTTAYTLRCSSRDREEAAEITVDAKLKHTLLLTTVNNGLSRTAEEELGTWVPVQQDGLVRGGLQHPGDFGTAFDGRQYTPRVLQFHTSSEGTVIPSLLHILGLEALLDLFLQISKKRGPVFEAYPALVHALQQLQHSAHPANVAMFARALANYHCPYTLHTLGDVTLEILTSNPALPNCTDLQLYLASVTPLVYPHQYFDVLLTIGRMFMVLGQFKRALHVFSASTALYGEHRATIYNIALSYARVKDYSQALICMERCRELSTHDPRMTSLCTKHIQKLQTKAKL